MPAGFAADAGIRDYPRKQPAEAAKETCVPTPRFLARRYLAGLVQARLEAESFPRLQMTLLVVLTGGAGLLASFVLLRLGVDSMAVRYPLAVTVAYGVFLLLLWLWLRTKAEDYSEVELPEPSGDGLGGAKGAFDAPGDAAESSAIGDAASALSGADELTMPLFIVTALAAMAVASFYVVYIAPTLFAELLVDGALSYVLYRRLRQAERQHWLSTAVKHTAWPFAVAAILLALIGLALSSAAPGAHTLGEVLHPQASADR